MFSKPKRATYNGDGSNYSKLFNSNYLEAILDSKLNWNRHMENRLPEVFSTADEVWEINWV